MAFEMGFLAISPLFAALKWVRLFKIIFVGWKAGVRDVVALRVWPTALLVRATIIRPNYASGEFRPDS